MSKRDFQAWEGFQGRIWKLEINTRDFIQKNYRPYDGIESEGNYVRNYDGVESDGTYQRPYDGIETDGSYQRPYDGIESLGAYERNYHSEDGGSYQRFEGARGFLHNRCFGRSHI